MARFDLQSMENAALAGALDAGEAFFRMGMACSLGEGTAPDLVSAHKWFNIAALKGYRDAARYRREVAEEMSAEEIAAAQRAAREWLTVH